MAITLAENFYQEKISLPVDTGAVNIYVTVLPSRTSGYLVISPTNNVKREIVKFTSTGSDGNGSFVTVTAGNRGLGGTTDQVHSIDEPVYMNVVAEHLQEVSDALDQLVVAGAQYASDVTVGIAKMSTDPANSLGTVTMTIASPTVLTLTAHGLVAGDSITLATDGSLPTGLTAGTTYYVIAAGLTANDFQIASTIGGTAINTSGSQSGTHTLTRTTAVAVSDNDSRLPSNDQVAALAGGGDYGTPSGTNQFQTEDSIRSENVFVPPVRTVFDTPTTHTDRGDATTQFDITDEGSNTFRYTWDGIGTDPAINATNYPVGSAVMIAETGFNDANEGCFEITEVSTNYFEVTNANGVAQTNVTLGNYRTFAVINPGAFWTKPANLKYVEVEIVAAGGAGGYQTDVNDPAVSNGGGGGGYAKSIIAASALPAQVPYFVGDDTGNGGASVNFDYVEKGNASAFGWDLLVFGGRGGQQNEYQEHALGGQAIRGQIKIQGGTGGLGVNNVNGGVAGGEGGDSMYGFGGGAASSDDNATGQSGTGFGAGGAGGGDGSSSARSGGAGTNGLLIITEHYI